MDVILKDSRTLTIPTVDLFEVFDACHAPDMRLMLGLLHGCEEAARGAGLLPSGFPGPWRIQIAT